MNRTDLALVNELVNTLDSFQKIRSLLSESRPDAVHITLSNEDSRVRRAGSWWHDLPDIDKLPVILALQGAIEVRVNELKKRLKEDYGYEDTDDQKPE